MKNSIEMFGAPIRTPLKAQGITVKQVVITVAVIGVATLIVVASIKATERNILAQMRAHEENKKLTTV